MDHIEMYPFIWSGLGLGAWYLQGLARAEHVFGFRTYPQPKVAVGTCGSLTPSS